MKVNHTRKQKKLLNEKKRDAKNDYKLDIQFILFTNSIDMYDIQINFIHKVHVSSINIRI